MDQKTQVHELTMMYIEKTYEHKDHKMDAAQFAALYLGISDQIKKVIDSENDADFSYG